MTGVTSRRPVRKTLTFRINFSFFSTTRLVEHFLVEGLNFGLFLRVVIFEGNVALFYFSNYVGVGRLVDGVLSPNNCTYFNFNPLNSTRPVSVEGLTFANRMFLGRVRLHR